MSATAPSARTPTGLVVAWTTPPANLDTLKFVAPANRRYLVTFDDKGIYVRSGRTAT